MHKQYCLLYSNLNALTDTLICHSVSRCHGVHHFMLWVLTAILLEIFSLRCFPLVGTLVSENFTTNINFVLKSALHSSSLSMSTGLGLEPPGIWHLGLMFASAWPWVRILRCCEPDLPFWKVLDQARPSCLWMKYLLAVSKELTISPLCQLKTFTTILMNFNAVQSELRLSCHIKNQPFPVFLGKFVWPNKWEQFEMFVSALTTLAPASSFQYTFLRPSRSRYVFPMAA